MLELRDSDLKNTQLIITKEKVKNILNISLNDFDIIFKEMLFINLFFFKIK